ncbi:hypothetical protein, partial, partial [Parasitella parasitica]
GKFGGGKSKSRKCYNCKELGWTPARNLVCKKRRTGKQKVQTAKLIVPMPLAEANEGATEEMDTDTEEREDQHLTFAALNINKDSQILEVKVNTNNKGFIKTCKKDNIIDKIGSTEEELTVTYNSRQCCAKFEIFDIFNDIDVVIGMDLIMKIGITISNMAMDWDDNNNPEIPPIDPNPYVPNESPYGTPAEREHFLKEIEPYIEANKNIDPKAYCNIPGSTLTLHVLKDHEHKMYRPQWPLEEKFLPAIKEQMAKWIKNGVIEPAPPGTPYNSPIFCVRKKTSTVSVSPGRLESMSHLLIPQLACNGVSGTDPWDYYRSLHLYSAILLICFCLSEKGLTLNSRKGSNVLDWAPKIANSKELQSRLGLINYFRSHLPCLSSLTAPLDAIKKLPTLISIPVLSVPNLAHSFCLVTDSSAYGIGVCLYQVINNRIYYNGFIPLYAFTKFRQWFWGNKFHLFLDNRGLLYIHSQEKLSRMIKNFYETIFVF